MFSQCTSNGEWKETTSQQQKSRQVKVVKAGWDSRDLQSTGSYQLLCKLKPQGIKPAG